jgi:hypothetical protein
LCKRTVQAYNEKFVEENLPKKILKEEREEQIPYVKVSSQKKKDPVTGKDVDIRLLLKPYGVGLFDLFDTNGPPRRLDISVFHPWWARMKQFLKSIQDRDLHLIEDLTEEQFQKLLEMLQEGETEGAFVGELQW